MLETREDLAGGRGGSFGTHSLSPTLMRFTLLTLAAAVAFVGCDPHDPIPTDTQRFRVEIENVATGFGVVKSGVFNTPVGAAAPGPIFPGDAYEFSFTAGPNVTPGSGMNLSFATMFIQSNDLFYTFPADGLALYDANGNARTGDVTSEVLLYDAGTEVNEAPGEGPNQAPRQSGPDTGTDENGVLGRITDGTPDRAGFTYPNTADVIKVTLSHDGDTEFTVRIENVSTPSTLATSTGTVAVPLSPGGWAVHVPTPSTSSPVARPLPSGSRPSPRTAMPHRSRTSSRR